MRIWTFIHRENMDIVDTEADSGGAARIFFAITCFFRNHFEELQTMLFEVELIITNKLLTYVYPNAMKICFTPNHLLFGRRLLYSSNTTSTVVRNLTVLWGTTDKINRISNHFLDRWRYGYVINLCETQQILKLNINSLKINVNYIVIVFYEKVIWHFWKITIVTRVLPTRNSEIRGGIVRTAKTNTILKCPVKKLFSVENTYDTNQTDMAREQKFRLWTLQMLNF